MIGRILGHYRILEKIGEGGLGEVYRAHDERLDRDVALKVLLAGTLADEAARKRFRREALILSKLNHPNIAIVYDFDTKDGIDFLAMEFISGVSLNDLLAAGPRPDQEIMRWGRQLAEALIEAHEQRVVHCDLKPSNIRISSKGSTKVLDFGIAMLLRPISNTAITDSFTETHGLAGTMPYMAPEQLRGESVDARTDIYSLGAVLYEMATGKRPFREELAPSLIDAILHHAPVPPRVLNARVSPELERTILKCLDKDPERRYQSAQEVRVDLERLEVTNLTSLRLPSLKAWLASKASFLRESSAPVREAIVLDVCVIRPGQLLSRKKCDAFKELVRRRMEDGYRLFVLDMTDTPSVNSLSAGAIVSSFTIIRMRMGKFVLAGTNKTIRDWLNVTKLYMVFDTYDTAEFAVSDLLDISINQLPPLQYVEQSQAGVDDFRRKGALASKEAYRALGARNLVRFGVFEVDMEAGELRKQGLKIKLQEKPFQVLCLLLERPSTVVTREELQKRLWPDTIVEFEHNLNAAVQRLRDALGDSADNPRFIETLPRRGYRFVAPVENVGA
jgi:anti-anti-sigma factor